MTTRRVRLTDGSVRELAPHEMIPDGATLLAVRQPLVLQDHTTTGGRSAEYRAGEKRATAIAFDAMITEKARAWVNPPSTTPPSTHGMRHGMRHEAQDRNPGGGGGGDARARLLRETASAWETAR